MNKALPHIKETVEEIREMLKNESQTKRQNRLQALYLIVTRQAKSRFTVAKMLGKNRNPISDWCSLYEAGGLEKLLEIYKPSGARAKITEEAIKEIEAALETAKGFRTYKEIHEMVVKKHHIKVGYSTVHNLVRYKLAAKAKVPRPSNPKKTKSPCKSFEQGLVRSSKK